MASEKIIYHCVNNVGFIILNQPQKRNAISAEMWKLISSAVEKAERDVDCKIIVVTGTGEHFAAGADISEFQETYATRDNAKAYTEMMLNSLSVLENCSKPTIAVIRGACIGGGCSIALACDMRFSNEDAKIGITPGKLGLVYSLADTRRLVQTVGLSNAKDLLYTARIIDADEAMKIHLIDRVSADAALETLINDYASQIASLSQWSVRATKQMFKMLNKPIDDDDPEALNIMLNGFDAEDFQEGYQAFLEKRKPLFSFE